MSAADLSAETPAEGWTIRDTVLHLHVTDVMGLAAARGDDLGDAFRDGYRSARSLSDPDLLSRWRSVRTSLVSALLDRPASDGKLPWVGPPMSAASFLTARLMETWAHGVDVRDALSVDTVFEPRLRHVADLGVRTFGWSFANRGQAVPERPSVSLTTPDGSVWDWGSPGAQGVSGPALDFCLLVVQRRPRASLSLVARGEAADAWLDIAQAYAGPPTDNRR